MNADVLGERLAVLGQRGTASVVVRHEGRVAVEMHWGPDGADQLDDVASVQKSVVALLVGVAWDRGLLDVDAPVTSCLGPGWSHAEPTHERTITVRHLLSMTSGLGVGLEATAPAGTVWHYNTPAYLMLKPVVTAAAGDDLNVLTAEWLAGPLGLRATSWVPREPFHLPEGTSETVTLGLRGQGFGRDPDGRWAHRMPDGTSVTGLRTTAADLARIGEVILAGGEFEGQRVVSTEWLVRVSQPSQERNPAYGWLFWCNGAPGQNAFGTPFERFQPEAPSDLIAARGANQQMLDVSRSAGVVVARTALAGSGSAAPGDVPVATTIWAAIRDAVG